MMEQEVDLTQPGLLTVRLSDEIVVEILRTDKGVVIRKGSGLNDPVLAHFSLEMPLHTR